jgi:hypothetical protein
MQDLTSDQLAELTFDNSAVIAMRVDSASRSFTIRCNRALLDRGDVSIEIYNVTIGILGYEKIQARIYSDDVFVNVDAGDETYHLAELCEFTAGDSQVMLSGFCNQEGAWSDYTVEGGALSITHG